MKKNIIVFLLSLSIVGFIIGCSSSNYVRVRQYAVSGDIATPMDARNFDIFILATGDVAGDVNREAIKEDVIGVSTFAGLAQAVRKFNENTLVVDAGNFTYGSRYAAGNSSTEGQNGATMIELARRIGYNAMNVGRYDLLYGSRTVISNKNAASAFVGVDDKKTEVFYVSQNAGNGIDKFKIFNFSGFKIGVLGLVTPDASFEARKDVMSSFPLTINYDELQRDINSLNRVVDYVVLLTNFRSSDEVVPRYTNIEEVASKIKGVDIIINTDGEVGSQVPKKVEDKSGKDVMIVNPGSGLESVGLVQFQVESGIPVGEPVFTLIGAKEIRKPETSNTLTQLNIIRKPENEDLTDYINSVQDKVNVTDGAPYAYMPYEFQADRQQLGSMQADIGFILADALSRATDSQVAIIPSVVIRNSLPSGEITKQDIFRAVPCMDSVVRVAMTGQEIYDTIEYGYGALPASIGRYPQTNLIVEYNATADEGNRVVSLAMQNGAKIEKNQQSYTVATLESALVGIYDYARYFRDRNRYTVPNPVSRGYRQAWEVFAEYLAQQYPVEYSSN